MMNIIMLYLSWSIWCVLLQAVFYPLGLRGAGVAIGVPASRAEVCPLQQLLFILRPEPVAGLQPAPETRPSFFSLLHLPKLPVSTAESLLGI